MFKKSDIDHRGAIEDIVADDDSIGSEEQKMLMNILGLKDHRADDVMVPRADIIAVDENNSLEDILEIFKVSQHSRLPIYSESLDNPLGFIHIKDALTLHLNIRSGQEVVDIKDIIRDILYIPGSVTVRDLLLKMQSINVHMALVVDEYGGTDGVVTIENLIEKIVGKIEDEHDVEDISLFTEKSSGVFEVDARLSLEAFEENTNLCLLDGLIDIDVDTIGGFVTSFLGRVPQRGEIIEYSADYEFHILDAEPKHIKKLRIIHQANKGT